ncbi:hypothetical protein J4E89_007674 [Alternaria sp. Ai002NY15]|nr:hypothetical protein J4E89_007674 [Alternaria sp. Ai002NY15]
MAQTQHEHASDDPRDGSQTNSARALGDNPIYLHVIGRGTCGTIYTSVDLSTAAYKIGRDRDALWNDIRLTAHVNRSLTESERDWKIKDYTPRVPAIKGWIANEAKEDFWAEFAGCFTEAEDKKTAPFLFSLSLIPTLGHEVRHALMTRYEFTTSKAAVFANPENDFCLARPYLGLATRKDEPLCRSENLWNFPLTREDLRSFPFDDDLAIELAKEMATGLAIIHWHALVDGMDIEFVLGGVDDWDGNQVILASDLETSEPFCSSSPPNLVLGAPMSKPNWRQNRWDRTHHMSDEMRLYILDFDKASLLSFDRPEAAIQRLVTAVTCNDPYFPDPAATEDGDKQLWNAFRATYLETAHAVSKPLRRTYGKRARGWPLWFMGQWEKKAEQLSGERHGAFIEFGD